MGQVQSDNPSAPAANQTIKAESLLSSVEEEKAQQPHSMEALIAEATAFGDSATESLDAKVEKALECPCVAPLRSGPCGTQFTDAFRCFLKSTAEEKGSDCVHPFVALQNCIKLNPDAFSKAAVDSVESKKEEKNTEENKISPPTWSKEPKAKL